MKPYRGRFAPSPTGPLHFGSLAAAAASWLDARAANGQWFVRIEDLDTPRCVKGAEAKILQTLEECGLNWDGAVTRQSTRIHLYHDALQQLQRIGLVYPCGCTRKEISDSLMSIHTPGETPYPGTCRNGLKPGRTPRAWRFRIPEGVVEFKDRLQGKQQQDVEREVGDFVILRADGIWAYQFAVVVDDADQGMTHVVRGADLLHSTPRQIALQRAFGFDEPSYLHVAVAANEHGDKLSKQTRAREASVADLPDALRFLGLTPPDELQGGELLQWAVTRWDVTSLPVQQAIPLPPALQEAENGRNRPA